MADPFVYSDRTGTAVTGTSSQTLLGETLTIPTTALEVDTEFQSLFAGTYHNDTTTFHTVNLDLTANGSLIHRSPLTAIAQNATHDYSIIADHNIIVTESNTAMVICRSRVSAAGGGGQDRRAVSTIEIAQPFDITAPVTLDLKATLSGVSDLATHSLTPHMFRMNTLGTFTVTVGGPSNPIDLPFVDQLPYVCQWTGSAYNTRPTLPYQVVIYTGPVEPNGVNSPGGPGANDIWYKTSGA